MPNSAEITVVSVTKAIAAFAPVRRFLAKLSVLLRLPLGAKSLPGVIWMVTPVKDSSNSSGDT